MFIAHHRGGAHGRGHVRKQEFDAHGFTRHQLRCSYQTDAAFADFKSAPWNLLWDPRSQHREMQRDSELIAWNFPLRSEVMLERWSGARAHRVASRRQAAQVFCVARMDEGIELCATLVITCRKSGECK